MLFWQRDSGSLAFAAKSAAIAASIFSPGAKGFPALLLSEILSVFLP
ncbi:MULTISPECIES: hypothetical protein [Fischerella]|nr:MULTISPECIES: hypothetical protein [Fischerella]MBD2432609.1 hypothetical protein [Fischerella sp. FACHB-380]